MIIIGDYGLEIEAYFNVDWIGPEKGASTSRTEVIYTPY
jgi:hypothetical protein